MKGLFLCLLAGGVTFPAIAADTPSNDPARRFARDYLSAETWRLESRRSNAAMVDRCVKEGKMSSEDGASLLAKLDLYMQYFTQGMPKAETGIADEMRPRFSPEQMREVADFFDSTAGQHIFRALIAMIVDNSVASTNVCGEPPLPPDPEAFPNAMKRVLSPDEMAKFRAFALSGTGRVFFAQFKEVIPRIGPILRPVAADAANKAGVASIMPWASESK